MRLNLKDLAEFLRKVRTRCEHKKSPAFAILLKDGLPVRDHQGFVHGICAWCEKQEWRTHQTISTLGPSPTPDPFPLRGPLTRDEFDSAIQEAENSCRCGTLAPRHAVLFNVETGDFERFQPFRGSDPTGFRAAKVGKPKTVCFNCLTKYFGNPQFMGSINATKNFPKLNKIVYLPIDGLTFDDLQVVQVMGA